MTVAVAMSAAERARRARIVRLHMIVGLFTLLVLIAARSRARDLALVRTMGGGGRDVLALSLRASLNAPIEPTRFGVFRM